MLLELLEPLAILVLDSVLAILDSQEPLALVLLPINKLDKS